MTKRTLLSSAAEPLASPKKRASLAPEPKEVVSRTGKRKILVASDDANHSPVKSPKKSSITAVTTRRSAKNLPSEETIDVSLPSSPEKVVLQKVITARITRKSSGGKLESEPATAKVRAPRKAKVIPTETEDPFPVTAAVIPRASTPAVTAPAVFVAASQDARKFYVPVAKVDDNSQDETIGLSDQYWSTLNKCFVTVGPVFLFLILVLYAVSVVTESQSLASIGLVYVFMFLIIMGSYYCATLPFIIASNTVSRLMFPNGTSTHKDLIRVAFLVTAIVAVLAYSKYGDTFF